MSTGWLAVFTAVMLGGLHAFEVDHMVAVTSFLAERPGWRSAAGFGLRWGLGHGAAVIVVGAVILATGLKWPAQYDIVGEVLVGAMLVAIGIWAAVRARKLHIHPPEEHGNHLHVHAHPKGAEPHRHHHGSPGQAARPHRHGQSMLLIGLVHGLAGTSSVIALVPVTLIDRRWVGFAYLAAFSAGVLAGMMAFALLATAALRHSVARSVAHGRAGGVVVGALAAGVGVWWMVRALG